MAETELYQTILLFGAPGSGKGTQGQILEQIPGFHHLSTGDMFRNLDMHSDLGKIFYEYSSKGELVPDELTVRLWKEYTHALGVLGEFKPHRDLLVLDGIPRTVEQAQLMDDYIEVLEIVHLVCSDREAMVQRLRHRALKQNRVDDAREEVILNRWKVYEEETRKVLDYYDKNLICEVDAMGSPASVLQHVLEVVTPVQDAYFSNALGA